MIMCAMNPPLARSRVIRSNTQLKHQVLSLALAFAFGAASPASSTPFAPAIRATPAPRAMESPRTQPRFRRPSTPATARRRHGPAHCGHLSQRAHRTQEQHHTAARQGRNAAWLARSCRLSPMTSFACPACNRWSARPMPRMSPLPAKASSMAPERAGGGGAHRSKCRRNGRPSASEARCLRPLQACARRGSYNSEFAHVAVVPYYSDDVVIRNIRVLAPQPLAEYRRH